MIGALLLTTGLPASGEDLIATRLVTLAELLGDPSYSGNGFLVPMPVEFSRVTLKKNRFIEIHWMRSEDVAKSEQTGLPPSPHGEMLVDRSKSVKYDAKRDFFVQLEEPELDRQVRKVLPDHKLERFQSAGRAVVIETFSTPGIPYKESLMYVATHVGSEVISISYLPERNSKKVHEFFWKKFRELLEPVAAESRDGK